MEKKFEERHRELALFSPKAGEVTRELDLKDRISSMDSSFSLDGFGKWYHDLGKACETSKLSKLSGKCVDYAKKFADEVAVDWFGMESDAIDVQSEPTICERIKPEVERSKKKEHINLAIFGVSDNNSIFADTKNAASDSSCEIYASLGDELIFLMDEVVSQKAALLDKSMHNEVISQEEALLDESMDNEVISQEEALLDKSMHNEAISQEAALLDKSMDNEVISQEEALLDKSMEIDAPEALQDNNMASDVLSSKGDFIPNEAHVNDVISSEAPEDHMTSDIPSSKGNFVPNEAYEVSKSHDGSTNVGPSDMTDDTTAGNIENFLKPNEFGFEDVDLRDDWEDDTDYELNLVSYYASNKKHSKEKMAAKFISRLRRSMKSRSGEVAHIPDVNSADSDWELL